VASPGTAKLTRSPDQLGGFVAHGQAEIGGAHRRMRSMPPTARCGFRHMVTVGTPLEDRDQTGRAYAIRRPKEATPGSLR
jgi:hypothetical protein